MNVKCVRQNKLFVGITAVGVSVTLFQRIAGFVINFRVKVLSKGNVDTADQATANEGIHRRSSFVDMKSSRQLVARVTHCTTSFG